MRAVATNTVRRLASPQTFLTSAEAALGHPIEVVSGREEGRLIFLGAAHDLPASREPRLVIDVGGGSTEFIIGRGLAPLHTESVQAGCIASTLRFFPGGKLTRKRWQRARSEIGVLLQQFAEDFRESGWQDAYGSSGTAKSIGAVVQAMKFSDDGITPASLAALSDALIEHGQIGTLKLPGLVEGPDLLEVRPSSEHQRRGEVAQVMQPNRRQAGVADQLVEDPGQLFGVPGCPVGSDEEQAAVDPPGTGRELPAAALDLVAA